MKRFVALMILLITASAHAENQDAVISLKTFREILSSLSQATKVSAFDADVQRQYKSSLGRLPKTGDVSELKTPTVMAVLSLSSTFCRKMIDKDAVREANARYLHKKVDFKKAPSAMGREVREAVINEYANVLWLRDALDEETKSLLDLMKTGEDNGAEATDKTKNMLTLTCSTMASSPAFLAN